MKILITTLMFLAMTGCSTIYFHRGTDENQVTHKEWHHNGIFGLVEFSDPVDLSNHCGSSWKTIKTEETFIQGLIAGVTYRLYDPWMFSYSCASEKVEAPKKKSKSKS